MTFFHARLNYLMSIIGIKNSDLSKRLFVDSSLVSRWKTGKRMPNEENIHNIATTIIDYCDTYKKKNALCKGININYNDEYFDIHFKTLEYTLFLWLTKDNDDNKEDVEVTFLQNSLNTSVYSERPTMFEGEASAKYCLRTLLNMAIKRGENFTIFIFSNSSLEWLTNDNDFFSEFKDLINKAKILKANVNIIYQATNKPKLAMCYAKLWSELQKLDNSEIFGLTIRENVMRQFTQLFIVIPQVGVIMGWNHVSSIHKYYLFLTDDSFMKHIIDDCGQLLLKCEPLLNHNITFSYEQLVDTIVSNNAQCQDMLYHNSFLTFSTMPTSVFHDLLKNANMPKEVIDTHLQTHKKYVEWFDEFIKNGRVEYYYYHSHKKNNGSHVIPHSELLFGKELRYTSALYRQHLTHIKKLINDAIQNNTNFNFFCIPSLLYSSDITIGYNSYMISYDVNSSNKATTCFNQHFLNTVQEYISEKSRELAQDIFPQQRNIDFINDIISKLN